MPLLEILKEGWPYQMTSMFTILSEHLDQILLLYFLGPFELGLYVVARSAASVVAGLSKSLGVVTFSEAARNDRSDGFFLLAATVRRAMVVSLLLCALFIPTLPFLFLFIYGDRFSSAIPLSITLVFAFFFYGINSIIEQSLRGHGQPITGVYARLGGMCIFLIFSFISVNEYGVMGIAFAYTISQIVSLGLFFIQAVSFFDNASLVSFLPQKEDCIVMFEKLKSYQNVRK